MNWFRNRTAPLLAGAALFAAASIPFAVSPVMANGHSSARAAAKMVKTSKAKILLNAKGQTLYVFAPDPKGKSTCYDTCAKFWPPVLVPSGTTVAAKQNKLPGTFGTAARTDGTQQLTYDGAPLYTFAGDTKAGDMNGQGLIASGGYWWVVVAAGKS